MVAEAKKSKSRRRPAPATREVGTDDRFRVVRGKDAAVTAARQLGREVLKVQVKRSIGRVRNIAEFEVYADEAADWLKHAKEVPTHADALLKPTAKLAAALVQPVVGPFKTKEELFDALEAADEGRG